MSVSGRATFARLAVAAAITGPMALPQMQAQAPGGAPPPPPASTAREDELNRRIDTLERRIADLENLLRRSGTPVAAEPAPPPPPAPVAPTPPQAVAKHETLEPTAIAATMTGTALAPGGTVPQEEVVPGKAPQPTSEPTYAAANPDYWGALEPGQGFKLAKTENGELNASGYLLARYLNQMPGSDTYQDHLGNTKTVSGRNDIQLQRVLVFLNGWVYSKKLRYDVMLWTVNSTGQVTIAGKIGYSFHPALNVFAGIAGMPGIRSLTGTWPYFYASDRLMAEEFFRPGFTSGVWSVGALSKTIRYYAMLGNNLSQLGLTADRLTRSPSEAVSVWYMPTGEFGPRGGFGDYERHQNLSTRFGFSFTHSPEERGDQPDPNSGTDNVQVRLSDGNLLFAPGGAGTGVTVQKSRFLLYAMDAGMKYHGFALHGEGYLRSLDKFQYAVGQLPYNSIKDRGFFLSGSYTLPNRHFDIYALTSQIFGQFNNSSEYGVGTNYYPLDTRNWRVNLHVLRPDRSPVSSTFGYYVAGQKGATVSIGSDIFF